jgi:hypothetical protein
MKLYSRVIVGRRDHGHCYLRKRSKHIRAHISTHNRLFVEYFASDFICEHPGAYALECR